MTDKAPGAMGRLASTGANLFSRPAKPAVEPKPKSEPKESSAPKPKAPKVKEGELLARISTDLISPWNFADRPLEEFGDIQELIFSITTSGQSVPALVRPAKGGRYELIYGRRRYEACKRAGIDLWVVIRELDDRQAFIEQHNENERENLSAWARSLSYQAALDNKLYPSSSALAASLGLDRTTVSNILTFQRLPKSMIEAVGNWSKVGIQTAKAILAAWMNDPKFEESLLKHKEALISGSLGPTAIRKLAMGIDGSKGIWSEQVKTASGLPVFSINRSAKGELTVTILSGGRSLVDTDKLKEGLLKLFEGDRV